MASGRRNDTDDRESKVCRSCGRVMSWRKAWAKNWDEVRYCSQACRRRRISPVDRRLEEAILALLDDRAGSICPSEAARAVAADEECRELLEPARRAARRLVAAGEAEITQHGRVVDPSDVRGPIRVRRVRP